jgi:hypothetical protein
MGTARVNSDLCHRVFRRHRREQEEQLPPEQPCDGGVAGNPKDLEPENGPVWTGPAWVVRAACFGVLRMGADGAGRLAAGRGD